MNFPLSPKRNSSSDMLSAVKHALHISIPEHLVGRENEINDIKTFIETQALSKTSASMYISGAPGTGKTACLSQVLADSTICKCLKSRIFINCMALRTAQKVYQRVALQMGASASEAKTFRHASNYIEEQLTNNGSMILVVLDEMDQLDSKNQEVLYMMFGWTSLRRSRLLLVGIANSLNLTDRILPRLQADGRSKPTVLNFKPYSREELLQILHARVQRPDLISSNYTVIDTSALQFCARKVAATSGDARKALDLCRRAVELLEIKSSNRLSSIEPPLKVGLMQMSNVISGACESSNFCSQSEEADSECSFPLQQKLMVCTLILLCKNIKCKEAPLGKLYESYTKICKKRQVPCVNQSEFFALCELVQSRGVVTLKRAKQLRLSQVKLSIQESDVEFAMKGKALLASILESGL